ncbi:uncharacterized protein LOC129687706 [Psammomys obesus]|uniref:uncharacterized protein LOC129687706 n=1 Tax=Psammomys obesus TaxID=48139 RepID=UPI0024535B9E|nr:uncharacterized protein LOC129687706 [Psammomys obesus]
MSLLLPGGGLLGYLFKLYSRAQSPRQRMKKTTANRNNQVKENLSCVALFWESPTEQVVGSYRTNASPAVGLTEDLNVRPRDLTQRSKLLRALVGSGGKPARVKEILITTPSPWQGGVLTSTHGTFGPTYCLAISLQAQSVIRVGGGGVGGLLEELGGGGDAEREEKEARLGEDVQMGEDEVEMELGMHRGAPTIHPSVERSVHGLPLPPRPLFLPLLVAKLRRFSPLLPTCGE